MQILIAIKCLTFKNPEFCSSEIKRVYSIIYNVHLCIQTTRLVVYFQNLGILSELKLQLSGSEIKE